MGKAAGLKITPRICQRCLDRLKKHLKIASAECSYCEAVKCEHFIRYSNPQVLCGTCVSNGRAV